MTVRPVLHLLRITIEAVTPISIGSGESVEKADTPRGQSQAEETKYRVAAIIRDANGLPTLPGPSLQGALRNLYLAETTGQAAESLFGFARGDDGAAGRLMVGWGAVHDSADVAVVGRRILRPSADPLLDDLRARGADEAPGAGGFERDHVALNERHVVAGRQKFARLAVPRGCRFSFELALWGEAGAEATKNDRAQLVAIARLFTHPSLRLGGSGGRGYGRVRLIRATWLTPSLNNAVALRHLRSEPPSTPFVGPGADLKAVAGFAAAFASAPVVAKLTLKPVNPWRVGGRHAPSMTEGTYGVRRADGSLGPPPIPGMTQRDSRDVQSPLREPIITWTGSRGAWVSPGRAAPWDFPVAGSAVKGPLVHRALYHFNRRNARFIDADAWLAADETGKTAILAGFTAACRRPPALETLLGAAKESLDAAPDGAGRAARLLVSDGAAVGVTAVQAIDHNMIDRFTGGVKGSAFYAEEVLVDGKLEITLTILPPFEDDGSSWPAAVIDPVVDALHDLCSGRLALGAKSLGYFTGEIVWSGEARAVGPWKKGWTERKA
jgi:CRISPR/Cas system CSM-associated protein Csm3 (group 7 of RAMP superfamily)